MTDELFQALAVATIMASLGLAIRPDQVLATVRRPRTVAVGLLQAVAICPMLAAIVATVVALPPVQSVGLVLAAAAPGTAMAAMFVASGRGDVTRTIVLAAVGTLLAAAVLPATISLASSGFDAAGLELTLSESWLLALRAVLVTAVPVALAVALRARRPATADRIAPVTRAVATVAFAAVVAGALLGDSTGVGPIGARLLFAAGVFVAVSATTAAALGRLCGLPLPQRRALVIMAVIHNGALAITLGQTVSPQLPPAAAAHTVAMLPCATLLVLAWRRQDSRRVPAPGPTVLTPGRQAARSARRRTSFAGGQR